MPNFAVLSGGLNKSVITALSTVGGEEQEAINNSFFPPFCPFLNV